MQYSTIYHCYMHIPSTHEFGAQNIFLIPKVFLCFQNVLTIECSKMSNITFRCWLNLQGHREHAVTKVCNDTFMYHTFSQTEQFFMKTERLLVCNYMLYIIIQEHAAPHTVTQTKPQKCQQLWSTVKQVSLYFRGQNKISTMFFL